VTNRQTDSLTIDSSMLDGRLTDAWDASGYWRQADVDSTFVVKTDARTDAENYHSSSSA